MLKMLILNGWPKMVSERWRENVVRGEVQWEVVAAAHEIKSFFSFSSVRFHFNWFRLVEASSTFTSCSPLIFFAFMIRL
jgi:hypothetical protein